MDKDITKQARSLRISSLLLALAWAPHASAITYANAVVTFGWIDASTHTQVGYNTVPYKFNGGGGCGTTPPTIDDTLSDNIPIGFTFMYGGQNFTQARIMTNGRLQFNNNTTCGYGSPVTQLPYPDANLNYTMRIYGNDLDPTAKSEVPTYNTTCLDRTSCYVSYATLGTAPYRSFVATWRNVPEWALGGSTSGNYNLQIILHENGEFIYQYGANTPGLGNLTAQVGWQVDSASDYDVPSVGYPASNSAIKFYIPRPVAEYRMEQPSWNGTAGEVFDTSGNGRHGVRVGSAQTTAGGKVCRGGNIPANADSTIGAIDTGISVPTTVGGVGTITFWFKPNGWTGAGVQSNQLFDATIANNQWFFLTKRRIDNSNARLRFTVRDSAGTTRTVETGNLTSGVLDAGGWVHVAVAWNFNALIGANQDRLRIYVNGALSQTSSFTTLGTVSAGIGTLYVGDNRSGFIEGSGTARSANGVVDEFRIYNYEGGLALVQRDMNQAGDCLSHYAISHAGTARACDENNVTVTAHNAAHSTVLMPNNTTQITLSTSTGKGDWTLKNGYGVLDNGTADDGVATYLFNGEYQAIFGLTHTTPGTVNISVTDGQIVEQEDPDLMLASCVTVSGFNACHDYPTSQCKAAGRLYTRLSGAAFATDVVALDSSGNVDTSFTGKAVVSLIARAATGGVGGDNCFAPDWTSTLDNAVTAFAAGRLTVNATSANAWRDARIKVVCDSANCPPSGITACSADNFAIRPQSFAVTSTNANADATGTSTTNTPAIKAGAAFNLTATAIAGYDGTPLLDNAQIAAHAGAIGAGTVSGAFGAADGATGVATGAAFGYSEVGYFRLNATGVYDGSFTSVDPVSDCTNDFSNTAVGGKFGCKFGNTAATSYFGRFIPDHFDTTVTNACVAGGFTYSGQPFPLTVTAENLAGGTTANYTGGFAKTVMLSDANGAAGAFSPATLAAGDFTNGVADHTTTPSVSFTFTSKLTAPATIRVRGTDGEATSADGTEGTTPLRSGRLWLGNAYGSDRFDLSVPFEAQYWNGNAFVTNTSDSCTGIASANINLGNKQGGLTGYVGPATPGGISAGKGSIVLTKPGTSVPGSVDLVVNLGATGGPPTDCQSVGGGTSAAMPWLSGKWCGANWDRNPTAHATFGVFGSSLKKGPIYLRESY
ncbi:MAG: LamG domain-containing protein [Candidatus Nitricoxidivorans perseverans]|uniref:LamG domain-containing protein n=1 Tax=Candidatus Nitricoxidivorans perseverans TaxID=2975601 RepID=A0AA49FJV9_9PROT|nr:MAG: LamG domain-containing protein [Candidatus Nitricoxidivorans perseverans]